ncbi:MAG: hypothetical protein ACK4VV_14100 [Pseudomonas sp.]
MFVIAYGNRIVSAVGHGHTGKTHSSKKSDSDQFRIFHENVSPALLVDFGVLMK